MIKVRYFYSACVSIQTPDASILCDPWFTDGIYDGSWFQYPRLESPLQTIPQHDYIYVSHIHPDHYDSKFLKEYLRLHPSSKILIADFSQPNYLALKMTADGIPFEITKSLSIGGTQFDLLPNESDPGDVDSALVVRRGQYSVINLNDNLYNENLISRIKDLCHSPTIALLSYTGAGPYPQTYFKDQKFLRDKATEKKEAFFLRYKQLATSLDAKINIPFAGKYLLGGSLAKLNPFRGIADATEVLQFDPKAVVLADGGEGWIDTESLVPSKVRTTPYDQVKMDAYARSLEDRKMDYEVFFQDLPEKALPIVRHLKKAYENARRKSHCQTDYYFCFKIDTQWLVMNANGQNPKCEFRKEIESLTPKSIIEIDYRYLFGLLTGVFHWNNAEIGSQYMVQRTPDIFIRSAQNFLSFLHL